MIHNLVPARMWQLRGRKRTIKMKTNTGRRRISILGALDILDLSVISTITEENCNSERVVEFFAKIRDIYPDKKIVIILDNARYNHAKFTTKYAEWYNIELYFLPPYSPNLNIIERLWRFTKKELVNNKYYENFEKFSGKVKSFFENINQYESELKQLLTLKFEII